MNWFFDFLQVKTKAEVYLCSVVTTMLMCIAAFSVTYFVVSNFSQEYVFRALILSFFGPIILTGPVLYFSFSHIRSIYILNQMLEKRERELSEFINMIPDIVARSDPNRRLSYVNQKYCEIVGHDSNFLVGRDFSEFVNKFSYDAVIECIESLSPDEPVCSHQQFHINPDDSERWIYWTNMMRYDLNNQPIEILSIGKDITELQTAHKEIEAQAEKLEFINHSLEQANQELAQFSSIASHDLQEPLRKIGFFSKMLMDAHTENDPETVEYALEVIANSAHRGRTLVADLLTLSRTANELCEVQQTDIGSIVDQVISDFSVLIKDTKTQITNRVGKIACAGNNQFIEEIFSNLIQNAIKFVDPDKSPEIRIYISERDDEKVTCAVEDSGIGFSEEYAREIFMAFQRLHSRDEYEGTGIGLAIVAAAAKRLGWRVYAKSEQGFGSTFFIEIPVIPGS